MIHGENARPIIPDHVPQDDRGWGKPAIGARSTHQRPSACLSFGTTATWAPKRMVEAC